MHFASVIATDFPPRVLYRRAKPSGVNSGTSIEAQIDKNAHFAGFDGFLQAEKPLKRRLQTIGYPYPLGLENLLYIALSGARDGR
ncbi:MAG: hypothetical protein KF694_22335 [Mesorhizobium sp.]|nr:hypothetical protein [Mesorhizobium sp.]